MNEKILKHLMRTYAIIFFSFGLVLLIAPNWMMDILDLEHIQGYFWQILAFTYLLFIAAVSWQTQKNEELMNLVIFIKFASAIIFIISGVIFLTEGMSTMGLVIGGIVDSILGSILVIFKKYG